MTTTEYLLHRMFHNEETTIGYFKRTFPDKSLTGFTVEDEPRVVKVKGETRIPAGRYKLALNTWVDAKGVPSPLTQKYRQQYKWFTWHIEITNIPNFKGVYIHVGNDQKNTDGCVLLNDVMRNLEIYEVNPGQQSTVCYERFYKDTVKKLLDNEDVWLTIKDEL